MDNMQGESARAARKAYKLRSATSEFEAYSSAMPQIPQDLPPRIPAPSHRHGAPSGPWPFLDIDDQIDPEKLKNNKPSPPLQVCDHLDAAKCKGCWSGYPQSLFPNWTPAQQRRSRISKIVEKSTETCTIRYVDVAENGQFSMAKPLPVTYGGKEAHWEFMRAPRPTGTRLRAMFLENLSGPVLQMIGTKYNVEPFFFSSSLGWIPARYQEEVKPTQSDHITIILTFVRAMQNPTTVSPSGKSSYTASTVNHTEQQEADQAIDTQASLSIRSSNHILLPDLLALHMVRSPMNSTIISYHPGQEHRTTTAASLHTRLSAAGRSVYWNNMFSMHDDPTFVFLSILWYAAYAWDEALEVLYKHICWLESRVISTNDMDLTQELHIVQAHVLHYASLLADFRKSVNFVLETPYPALDNHTLYSAEKRAHSQKLMKKECDNLMREIGRLEKSRAMQGKRLKNVMNLGFSSVNIKDSKQMQELTKATVKDSEAMKQIGYLTMFFLPASLVASVFGMNVGEINPGTTGTIPHYLATAFTLTAVTIWVVVALQYHPGHPRRAALREGNEMQYNEEDNHLVTKSILWDTLGRIGWPIVLALELFERRKMSARANSRVV